MGQPPAPRKRPPFTRLHAVIVLALIMFIATVASFFSNDVEATRNIEPPQLIKLNDEALSQIHASLNVKNNSLNPEPAHIENNVQIEQNQTETNIEQATTISQQAQPELKETVVKIKSGHSLSAIFRKHRLSHQDLYSIMQKGPTAKALRNFSGGSSRSVYPVYRSNNALRPLFRGLRNCSEIGRRNRGCL